MDGMLSPVKNMAKAGGEILHENTFGIVGNIMKGTRNRMESLFWGGLKLPFKALAKLPFIPGNAA